MDKFLVVTLATRTLKCRGDSSLTTKLIGLFQSTLFNTVESNDGHVAFKSNLTEGCLAGFRLGHAEETLNLLLCGDYAHARKIAGILGERNNQRRAIEEKVFQEANQLAKQQLEEKDRSVLVLSAEGWHRGILGIVASRIAQEILRPVVLVSFEGDMGKGSIRSVDNLGIMDAVLSCRTLLEDFGGHRMAAGISLKRENLPRRGFYIFQRNKIDPNYLVHGVKITVNKNLNFHREQIVNKREHKFNNNLKLLIIQK